MIRYRFSTAACTLLLLCLAPLRAQRPPNANATYQQLRNLLPGGEVIAIHNLELKRDAATFTFASGSVAFYGEVNGKVTGAVFRGEGHLHITPPTPEERHNLSLVMQTEELDEDFDRAVLRFTDATAADLHNASAGPGNPDPAFTRAAEDLRNLTRHTLHDNLDLRLLADVLSPAPGGFFSPSSMASDRSASSTKSIRRAFLRLRRKRSRSSTGMAFRGRLPFLSLFTAPRSTTAVYPAATSATPRTKSLLKTSMSPSKRAASSPASPP